MNRFRRKSDARSRPTKASTADGDSSANLGSNGGTTPAGEPPSVQLPNIEEFRTSLILPNLMRRFSLLRGQDGQLVDLQTIQNHLAIQRQTGRLTAYEVDVVLEQYKLQSGIESTASSPSLPKRKRIDWSLVEDEAAFLDSLSQAPSSSSTSFVTVNDETQSSLASSMTRPRVPAPPVPSDLGLSATFLPSLGTSGLDSSSPPASARSIPLSTESSSGGASSTSQGYPHRVKRGTNGLFGGRALDARELKMLRSTSGHSLEASTRSNEGPVGDRVETEVESDRAPATQYSPDPAATTALSPTASMESSEPHPQTSSTDSSAPSTTVRDEEEEPTTSANYPAGPSAAVLADSPTTPLSANQLRRISTALEAIEVELAKTFTRMSWTAELDEDAEDVGARGPSRTEAEGDEAQAVDHSAQAEEAAIDAAEERGPAFDGRRSPDVDSTSPLDVPHSPADEIESATTDEYQLFDMSRASDDTVPPSPISPVTDSDLRGVGTFEAAAAPRSEFEAMADPAAAAESDVEELDPFCSRTAAGATTSSSDGPAAGALPSEQTMFVEVSPEADGATAAAGVGGSPQDGGAALAATPGNEDEAGTDHVVPLRQPRAVAGRASSARASLARESFASFRSTGSSFHPVDDARLHSDEDFGLSITASQSSALQSEIDAFSSQSSQSHSGSGNVESRPRRISALAIDTSAPARTASLSFDRRPTEELLQVLAAATKRLSASGADKDLYLTHEDVLAIQARLVRNAAAQRAGPIEANVEEDGTTEDSPAPIVDGSDERPTESARPQEQASEDEAVERLAGLGLDDFASTEFTQPSPQQANARVFAAGTAESSPGSSAGKPSPVSYLRSPASVSMAAQSSQRTYDSNVTFSSAQSGVTTSPSDAFEYSSLVTSTGTDQPEHGTPPSVLAADSGTAQTGADDVESFDAPNAIASAGDPSRSGETLPASETQGVEAKSEAPTEDSATAEPPVRPSVEPSTLGSSAVAESPPLRVPRTTPAPDRSGATSILVRDVRNQATLATNALKQHETGASPPRLLRKKSVRKQSISSPQLVSGPINIPAVPIASPKIIAEARSAFVNAATEDSPSALRRTRSVSDSKSKGIGSRFKRLLSKREGGSRPDADVDTAADTSRPSSKPARPSRAGADPITPPNQSTARFGSPQQSSPQTPSTIMSSPGGSTPRSSPRKKPVPSNVFPSKRSSLSQSHPSSPETATNGDSRENRHARNQSFSQAFATLPEDPASGAAGDAAPEAVDDPQHLERSVSFTRVEPLSPRRTESRQDSARTHSPTSPSTFRSGADRSARFSRDSVESMLRFRQAAEGLGLDPDKVQELVSSAYAGSSSHAYSGSISSSNDGNATLENHDDSWGRYREASHGSDVTTAAQANDRAREAHVHLQDAVSDASGSAEPGTSSSFGQPRHFSSLSRFADAGFAPPSMLAVPDRNGTLDSLAGPRSPGVESTTSRQSSSGYASSFLDYYAHEEGETDNEGPFNLSTGSTFDPRGDASIRLSVGDSADAQPASARVSGAPSGEVVWQVLDDLRTNRFSIASQGSSLGFGSHDSSNGADDPALVDQLAPVATLLRHRDRKRSSASMSSEWDRGRYPSIYLREEQALIELAQQGGIAVDESGRFLVRPKLDAPAVPPLPAEYRDQAHVIDSPTVAQPLELPDPNRSDDVTPTHADASSS